MATRTGRSLGTDDLFANSKNSQAGRCARGSRVRNPGSLALVRELSSPVPGIRWDEKCLEVFEKSHIGTHRLGVKSPVVIGGRLWAVADWGR